MRNGFVVAKVFYKYILVGLVNTSLTTITIFALAFFGVGVYYANAAGYAAGIMLSFVLNSIFTFESKISGSRLAKFLGVCLISYFFNLLVMKSILHVFQDKTYLAQILGVLSYTLTGYLLNKYWALK